VIVLFGAGASFGSVGVEPYPPPLGNGLFQELAKRGGVAASLPNHIQKLYEKNFEEGMAEFYKYSNGNIMSFQRELAGCLASFQPKSNNVYLKIIQALSCQRVIYSSLNYDLLFELSAAKLGFFTSYTSEYQKGAVRLLKIHGSSNFWPDIPTGMLRGCTISGSSRADIQAPIRPFDQIQTLRKCAEEDSVAPAIAMFAVGKAVKISPDFVEHQYEMWVEQVKKSSMIFIIGVRVHEVDEHIWSLIGKAKAIVIYFGFDCDKTEFHQWKTKQNKKNAYFFKSNFEDSVPVIKKRCRI
jgi:hypothetical protein